MVYPNFEKLKFCPPPRKKSNLKATIWPSGDFSIGYSKPPTKDDDEHPLKGIYREAIGIVFVNRQGDDNADKLSLKDWLFLFSAFEHLGKSEAALATLPHIERLDSDEASLGLSVVSNSPNSETQRKKVRGQGGLTTYQKRLVKSAGSMLEDHQGKHLITFLTCTLPTLEQAHMDVVVENWARLVKSFIKELTRELHRKGLPGEIVGVTEIQEKRYKKWGQVAPHLHLIFQGRKYWSDFWQISTSRVRDIWNRQIEVIIGAPFYGGATTRIEKPRKSLKAELGKYFTKGGSIIKQIIEDGKGHLLPTGWTICTVSLKNRVKRAIKTLSTIAIEHLYDRRKQLKEIDILRFRDIKVEIKYGNKSKEITVGSAGYFTTYQWRLYLYDDIADLDACIADHARAKGIKAIKAA